MAQDRQWMPKSGPKIANIGPKSRPSAAKTAYRGPKSGPGPHVEAQEQLKIANLGRETAPRPPTQAPKAAQDRTQRPQERPKTNHTGPSTSRSTSHRKRRRKISKKKHAARQLYDRPSIENIEEKTHRQNMLPVNFRSDSRTICPLTISL